MEYDYNGNLIKAVDAEGGRTLNYAVNAYGQYVRQTIFDANASETIEQNYYYLNGSGIADVGNLSPSFNDYYSNTYGSDTFDADSSFAFFNPGLTPSVYTLLESDIVSGDVLQTLSNVALRVWGDAGLWHILADANGIQFDTFGDAIIQAGKKLLLPNISNVNTNVSVSSYTPYDPTEIIGNTSPTIPEPPPPPKPDHGGCSLKDVFAVVVVSFATAFGTALGSAVGSLAGPAGTVIGAGVGAAIGNYLGQALNVELEFQESIDYDAVRIAGFTAGITRGVNTLLPNMNSVQAGLVNNLVSQGVSYAVLGEDNYNFNWWSLSATVITSPLLDTSVDGLGLPIDSTSSFTLEDITKNFAKSLLLSGTRQSIMAIGHPEMLSGPTFLSIVGDALGSALGTAAISETSNQIRRSAQSGRQRTTKMDAAATPYAKDAKGNVIAPPIDNLDFFDREEDLYIDGFYLDEVMDDPAEFAEFNARIPKTTMSTGIEPEPGVQYGNAIPNLEMPIFPPFPGYSGTNQNEAVINANDTTIGSTNSNAQRDIAQAQNNELNDSSAQELDVDEALRQLLYSQYTGERDFVQEALDGLNYHYPENTQVNVFGLEEAVPKVKHALGYGQDETVGPEAIRNVAEPTAMSIPGAREFEDQYRTLLQVNAYDSSVFETFFKGIAVPHNYYTQDPLITDPFEELPTQYLPESHRIKAEGTAGRMGSVSDVLDFASNSIQDVTGEFANRARMEFTVYEHTRTGERTVQITSYSQDLLNGGQITPHVVTKPQAIKVLSNPSSYDIYLRER